MANLNELSNEQREAHRKAVCVAVGLNPDPVLGHLDYIWMDQESGPRSLVLYAKRGTTELLRDINGIDIKSLEQHDGPGYVSFKVTAVNKKGRQEIAVGAHEIEGLRGKKLADAIATAQTRALRRVTLQFAGHGILDESEVTVQLTNIPPSAASSAQLAGSPAVIPPPQVSPSATPGRDITALPSPEELAPRLTAMTEATKGLDLTKDGYMPPASSQNETPAPLVNQTENLKQVYAEGAAALAAMKTNEQPDTEADIKPTASEHSVAQNPPNQGVSLQEIAANKPDIQADIAKPKRTRKKRGQVDLASPGQERTAHEAIMATSLSTPVPVREQSVEKPSVESKNTPSGNIPSKTEVPAMYGDLQGCATAAPPIAPSAVQAVPAPAPLPQYIPPAPAPVPQAAPVDPAVKAKYDDHKARVRKYSNDVLPNAGMIPTSGVGGCSIKLKKFSLAFTGAKDVQEFSEEQWEDLFEFLDGYVAQHGAPALVQYIDKALGVTQ